MIKSKLSYTPLPVCLHVANRGNFPIESHVTSSYISDGQYHKFIFLVPISNKSRRRDGIIQTTHMQSFPHPPVRSLSVGCVVFYTHYSSRKSTKWKIQNLLLASMTKSACMYVASKWQQNSTTMCVCCWGTSKCFMHVLLWHILHKSGWWNCIVLQD